MRQWFYIRSGQQRGPVEEQQFFALFRNKDLPSETLVWTDGLTDWTRADRIQNLVPVALVPPPLPISPPPMPPVEPLIDTPPPVYSQSNVVQVQAESALGIAVEYAGFWRRSAAVLIDGLILLVPNLILNRILSPVTSPLMAESFGWFASLVQGTPEPFPIGPAVLLQLTSICASVLPCLYFAAMQGRPRAATVGKGVVGSVVLQRNGMHLSFWSAFLREIVKTTLWSLSLGLAMLPAAFTERKQALHDVIFSTVVVQRKSLGRES